MSRFTLRRDRILPGPLRSLQRDRRGGFGLIGGALVPAVALALAGAASLAALPRLAARPSAEPVRSVPRAQAPTALPDAPAKVAALAPEAPMPATAPEPPAVKPETLGSAAADPGAKPPVTLAAEPAAAPEPAEFRLDMLPVLQAGLDLDAGPAVRQAAARPSRSARRTAASSREAAPAAGEPVRP